MKYSIPTASVLATIMTAISIVTISLVTLKMTRDSDLSSKSAGTGDNDDNNEPASNDMTQMVREALEEANQRILFSNSNASQREPSSHNHHLPWYNMRPTKSSKTDLELERQHKIYAEASQILSGRTNLTREEARTQIETLNGEIPCIKPEPEVACVSDLTTQVYRTYDGSCNNKYGYGMADSTFQRVIPFHEHPPPPYKSLEFTRRCLTIADTIDTHELSNFLVIMGQFLAHDMTAMGKGIGGDCCDAYGVCKNSEGCACTDHPFDGCVAITKLLPCNLPGSESDPLFRKLFINRATSFLDLSLLYGLSEAAAKYLRQLKYGLMKVNNFHGYDGLPLDNSPNKPVAGDDRWNEHSYLIALHTFYLHLHNFFARRYIQKCTIPGGETVVDETVYQGVRKLLIAIYQKIIVCDLLRAYFGDDFLVNIGMDQVCAGTGRTNYEEDANPSTYIEWAVVYWRFHSMLNPYVCAAHMDHYPSTYWGTCDQTYKLGDTFFDSGVDKVYGHDFRAWQFMLGMIGQPAQKNDLAVTYDMQHRMYSTNGYPTGLTIPAYTELRQFTTKIGPACEFQEHFGTPKFTFENCLLMTHDNDDCLRLFSPHCYGLDADKKASAWFHMLAERPEYQNHEQAVAGSITEAMNIEQYKELCAGDRFYFSHTDGHKFPFTDEQFQLIVSTTFSHLLCWIIPGLEKAPRNVFYTTNFLDPDFIYCSEVKEFPIDKFCPKP